MSPTTRRDLLRTASAAALAGLAGGDARGAETVAPAAKSRAVLVRSAEVLDEAGSVRGAELHRMLNRGVAALVGEAEPAAAWRRLVRSTDVVGVKSNVWQPLCTPPELEAAIREEIRGVGVADDRIAVDDRGVRDNPVFARATALINVRPMRTHHWSGLGTCIKNLIPFVPRPPEYHGDACASLGAIWKLPELAGKVRLNILVMLTPQFHGVGPHSFSPRFVWPYGGLLLSTEPAPVDAVGARIIEAQRRRFFGEDRPLSPPPHHIRVADERYGLGAASLDRIELIRIGPEEGALV